ncbi:insulin-like growth factor-binding protein 6 [Oryzias melastigma]|uniref:Thyroglobulin type-1 domain-containing protein n=1 Tax=Oryzias melastigma TaxID=30732 RepID=A0A3B3DYN1_ORYME|nr:insulin-like growth factor-binding protein 6 [Oryzias melastigma]XP_024126464.1 insulin-like growth factor-binding protein 6 [Oryzias melastigma]XP_036067778.1 insulin-like growth factor-binding protein 6 [Oryzias melastigma]
MLLHILVMFLLKTALSSPLTTLPQRGCPTCKSQAKTESGITGLALGDPCGVYTRSCAHGLRCQPSEDETRPLHALLEGRGVCRSVSSAEPTQQTYSADPSPAKEQNEAPCRKLLTTLMRGLHAHVFQSHHDIYMPNCDKRGFFRKKQCWSSGGKWRGKCWCVDENGTPISENLRSSQSC